MKTLLYFRTINSGIITVISYVTFILVDLKDLDFNTSQMDWFSLTALIVSVIIGLAVFISYAFIERYIDKYSVKTVNENVDKHKKALTQSINNEIKTIEKQFYIHIDYSETVTKIIEDYLIELTKGVMLDNPSAIMNKPKLISELRKKVENQNQLIKKGFPNYKQIKLAHEPD